MEAAMPTKLVTFDLRTQNNNLWAERNCVLQFNP